MMRLYFKWPRRYHRAEKLVPAALLGATPTSNSKLKYLFGRKWSSGDILKYLADIHFLVRMPKN